MSRSGLQENEQRGPWLGRTMMSTLSKKPWLAPRLAGKLADSHRAMAAVPAPPWMIDHRVAAAGGEARAYASHGG